MLLWCKCYTRVPTTRYRKWLECKHLSLESIVTSNHSLQQIDWPCYLLPEDLSTSLELNTIESKVEVIRQKILRYHFMSGQDNIRDLVDLDMAVLPHAMSWIGRDRSGYGLLYQLVRNMPAVLGCVKKVKTKRSKRKRLRKASVGS